MNKKKRNNLKKKKIDKSVNDSAISLTHPLTLEQKTTPSGHTIFSNEFKSKSYWVSIILGFILGCLSNYLISYHFYQKSPSKEDLKNTQHIIIDETVEKISNINMNDLNGFDKLDAEKIINISNCQSQGKYNEASKIIFEIESKYSNKFCQLYFLKGNNFLFSKLYFDAIKEFEKAIILNPNYVEAINNMGVTYAEIYEYNKSIEYYDKSLKINSNNLNALINKSYALIKINKFTEALEICEKITRIKPDLENNIVNKGIIFTYLNKFDDAITQYDNCIKINPNNLYAISNKAYVLNLLKKYGEAIQLCDQAIKLNPYFPLAWRNKGEAYFRLNKIEEAKNYWQKATEYDDKYYKMGIRFEYEFNKLKNNLK